MTTYDEHVRRVVDAAPPLTAEQKDRLRILLSTPDDPESISAWTPPRSAPAAPPRCGLYRHFDAEGILLYVGIAKWPDERMRQHASQSGWQRFAARMEAEWFDTRDEASRAEVRAVAAEKPIFNKQYAAADQQERAVRYLVEHGAFELLRTLI